MHTFQIHQAVFVSAYLAKLYCCVRINQSKYGIVSGKLGKY